MKQVFKYLAIQYFIFSFPIYSQINLDSIVYEKLGKINWEARERPTNAGHDLHTYPPLDVLNALKKLEVPLNSRAIKCFTHYAYYFAMKNSDPQIRQAYADYLVGFLDEEKYDKFRVVILNNMLGFYKSEDFSAYAREVFYDNIMNKGIRDEVLILAGLCDMKEITPKLLEYHAEGERNGQRKKYGFKGASSIAALTLARFGYSDFSEIMCKETAQVFETGGMIGLGSLPNNYVYIGDSLALSYLRQLLDRIDCVMERTNENPEFHCFCEKAKFALNPLANMLEGFPIKDASRYGLFTGTSIIRGYNPKEIYTMEDVEIARAWFRSNPEIFFKKH